MKYVIKVLQFLHILKRDKSEALGDIPLNSWATVYDKPAEGEYIFPDGIVHVFRNGILVNKYRQ